MATLPQEHLPWPFGMPTSIAPRVVRCHSPEVSEAEALAQSGHFNLGTGSAGTATVNVAEPEIFSWASGLLGSVLPVEVVVGIGVKGILTNPVVNQHWNVAPGGLQVDWDRPQTAVRS